MKIFKWIILISSLFFSTFCLGQGRIISIVGSSIVAYDNNVSTFDTLHTFHEREVPPKGRLYQAVDGTLYGFSYASFFKITPDGTGYEVIKRFKLSEGNEITGNFIKSSDNYFYGVAEYGGTGNGTLFKIQQDGSNFEVVHNFDNAMGQRPTSIIEINSGTLVGITSYGGSHGGGVIFKINKDGSNFTVLKHLSNSSDGSLPRGIMQASDNLLYGVNLNGGANGYGSIFKVGTDGLGFQILKDLDGLNEGGWPNGPPIEALNGLLYFPVRSRGNTGLGKGAIGKIAKDGTDYSLLKVFDADGLKGVAPTGKLHLAEGKIYGTTEAGGTHNSGTIYSIDINSDGHPLTVLKSLNKDGEGNYPYGGIIEGSDGILYGINQLGGIDDHSGTIYKLNKDGNNFSIINNFQSSDGLGPVSNLVEKNEIIYGTTDGGGLFGKGTIFSINADGTNFMTLHSLNSLTDGSSPRNLIIVENRIYGYCISGGSNEFYGTLFKMDLDGSNYTVIRDFDNPQGAYYLKLGSDDIIYGYHGLGTYFKLNPVGDVFTDIGQGFLQQPLTEDMDGFFYSALTSSTGFVIYKMNKDGSNIQQLFSSSDMSNNGRGVWRLELGPDGKLYGTTASGGNNSLGTYFSINRDGTGFNVIYQLGGGPIPFQRFQLLSDGNFYGYNAYISSSHFLKIPPDGSPVTSLKSYDVVEDGYGRDDYFIEIGGDGPTTPSCPTYQSPENGVDSVGNKTLLSWDEVSTATGYKIYVGTDGGGTQTPTNLFNGDTVLISQDTIIVGTDTIYVPSSPIFDLNNLQANTTFYWQVTAFNNNGETTVCPIWSFETAPSPSNDLCTNAIDLIAAIACENLLYTNLGSSHSMQMLPPQCKTIESDVWFKVRMPASGDLTIETQLDSSTFYGLSDVDMEIYNGDCSNGLTSIACGGDIDPNAMFPDFPNLQVKLDISNPSLANQMLYIRVWGGFGEQGNFNICAHDPSVTTNTCNPCDTFRFENTIFMGDTTFMACDSIISEMIIQNSKDTISQVTYEAGLEIILMPGFHAQAGVEFTAKIEDNCNGNFSYAPNEAANNREAIPSISIDKPKVILPELAVFPNPFKVQTNVQFTLNQPSLVQLELFDLTGKVVQTVVPKSHYETGIHQVTLQNDQLKPGIYFIKLASNQGQLVEKIMLVK